MRITLFFAATILSLAACSKVVEPPPPVSTIDLTGYFVLPSAGYEKFYSDGRTYTYTKDTVVNSHSVVDVLRESGNHDYHRIPDRAWVATLVAGTPDALFQFSPPLAGIPDQMPDTSDHVTNSNLVTQGEPEPVRRISRLIDTGLTVTVPAGMFDSVVLIRQEFWRFTEVLNVTVIKIDSVDRWYAPGVDEIRRVEWLGSDLIGATRELDSGIVNGVSYPIP